MIPVLIESALRSLVLALAVWLGLRLFRVRNVVAEKLAWTVVLAAALAMPLLAQVIAHWPRLSAVTLTLPAQPILPARLPDQTQETKPGAILPAQPVPAVGVMSQIDRQVSDAAPATAQPDRFATSEAAPLEADRFPSPAIEQTDRDAPPVAPAGNGSLTIAGLATIAYLVVAAALLFRLLYGLAITISLWRSAEPVSELRFGAGLSVRSSASIASPVTIASGILLPADFAQWDSEKLRIVLAHERSHIRQGDFYLQFLAGLYAAVLWLSPVGWWLKRKLSDLGEAIGDRSGLEEAKSYSSYAQVLLEFAAAPRPTMIGVAMARPSSLARRIERLLNPSAFRQAFAGGRRAILAAVLVPAVLFATTALVRVQAASQSAQQTPPSAQEPIAGQSHPGSHPNFAKPAPAPSTAPSASPAPTPQAKPGWPVHVNVPALHIDIPAIHVDVPANHVDIPAVHVDVPAQHFDVPAQHIDVPAVHVNVPAQHIDVPAIHIDVPAKQIDIPAKHIDIPPAGAQNTSGSNRSGGELMAMLSGGDALGLGHMFVEPVRRAVTEATFDRTLTFSGKLDLHISNGAGNIHLTRGTANQVKVHATIRSNSADDAEEVRSLAANPPIEQEGNTIRIGGVPHRQGTNHIGIDYEIEAPADAALEAMSGSGNIVDEGVGQGAKLQTGSGNITATGIQGGFTTQTGSGNIAIQNTGEGDAKAQTGSGDIEVKGVQGAFRAQTGSGEIKAEGTPVSAWRLEAGSGSIEFSPGSAPVTLDASTGSGSIVTAHELTMRVSSDRHHVRGQLNGGGPEVRLETGSGDIRID